MRGFIQYALENENEAVTTLDDPNGEPNETEKAIEMVNNEGSTDPQVAVKIANYKQELEALKQAKQDNQEEQEDDDAGQEVSESSDEQSQTEDAEPADQDESQDSSSDADSEDSEGGGSDDSDESGESTDASDESVEAPNEQDHKEAEVATENFHHLTKLYSVVEKQCNRGGMTAAALEMLDIQLDSIRRNLGINHLKKHDVVKEVALENYSDKLQTSKRVLLGLEDFLGDVWKAIKNFFKAIWEWIVSFFTGTRKSAKSARSEYEQHVAENKKLKDVEAKREELRKKDAASGKVSSNERYVATFKHKNAFYLYSPDADPSDPNVLNESYEKFINTIALYTEIDTILTESNKTATEMIASLTNSKEESALVAKLTELTQSLYLGKTFKDQKFKKINPSELKDVSKDDSFTYLATDSIATGARFFMKVVEGSSETDVDKLNYQMFGTSFVEYNRKFEVPLLADAQGVEKATELFGKIVKLLEDINKISSKYETESKKLTKLIEGVEKVNTPFAGLVVKQLNSVASIQAKVCTKAMGELIKRVTIYKDTLSDYIKQSREKLM